MILSSSATKGKSLLAVLRGDRVSPPPIWLMRQAGRYLPEYRALRAKTANFLEFCHTPELATEATLQPIERYGFDAAILFADILLVPEGMGQPLAYREGEGPVLEPIRSTTALDQLSTDRADDRLETVMETVRRVRSTLPRTCALIGFAGAPWTVAAYMVEGRGDGAFATARQWAHREPQDFGRLIDMLVTSTSRYLIAQAKAGADALQIFDSWAGLLPASGYRRWCIEPTAAIVAAVREAVPNIPIIGFPRGGGTMLPEFVAKTGVDAVSLDTAVAPGWAAAYVQPHCVIQGNLDPQLVVVGGDAMTREICAIVEAFAGGPHIFNLGHGLTPEAPPEHVAELVATVRAGRE